MTSADADWPRIKELLADALAAAPAERDALLGRHCPDPELRGRVLQLLHASEAASRGAFLEEVASTFAAPLLVEPRPGGEEELAALRTALAGRYAIEREIGRGGMAVVYLATDERHGRPVALKVLHTDHLGDGGVSRRASRFTREIGFVARLSHPNILPLYDSGMAAECLYYVTPFAQRESLRERLRREGRLSVTEAVRVMRDVTRALAHAHAHGIVHRDIKPGNILLTAEGDALVADFGIAKALAAVADGDTAPEVTQTDLGFLVGTPAYVAPEQLGDRDHVDHRADLYALGVVGFEMLSGTPPFTGRRSHELLAAHLTEPPPPLAERRPDAPSSLVSLIHRLLEKRPEHRPFDAVEVLQAIDGASLDDGAAAPRTPSRRVRTSGVELGTVSADAAEHYVKGRFLNNTRQRDCLQLSLDHYESAAALDPSFARAHAGIADVHVMQGIFGLARPQDAHQRALASAQRALALDPDLVEAHTVIAHALTVFAWDWAAAEEAFGRALALDPRFPPLRLNYASYLHATGRPSEALEQLEAARLTDPLVPTGMLAGRIFVDRGQPAAALKVLGEEVALDPRRDVAYQLLGHAHLLLGNHREAIAAMEHAATLSGPRDTAQLAYIHAVIGNTDTARGLLESVVSEPDRAAMLGFHVAMAHAGLGEADEAFRWLEAAFHERGSFMSVLAVTHGFDAIRGDPRFGDLLQRMGLAGVVRPMAPRSGSEPT